MATPLFRHILLALLICTMRVDADVLIDVVQRDLTRASGVLIEIDPDSISVMVDDGTIKTISHEMIVFVSMNTPRGDATRPSGVLLLKNLSKPPIEIKIVDVDERSLQFSSENGIIRTLPFTLIDFISMQVGSTEPNPLLSGIRSSGMLHLVDGRVLTGESRGSTGGFTWRNWWTGPITMTAEEIITFTGSKMDIAIESSDMDDIVSLSNGDRIVGFIDSIDHESITFEKNDGTILTIPIENTDQVRLANRITPKSGPSLWSTLGDRFVVDSIQYDVESGFRIDDRPMPASLIAGMAFENTGITSLSEFPIVLEETSDTPRFHLPQPNIHHDLTHIDASTIELKGPVRASWEFDQADLGLVCTLVVPPSSRRHADMVVRVLGGGEPLASFRMNASNPTADLAVRVPGTTLSIEILDSGGGPIMDDIDLQGAVLFETQ